jgi:hypothetical protein
MLFEILHHTRRRIQAEGAASREQNGVHALHGVDRIQKVCFACTRSRSADIHARNSASLEKNYRTAGGPTRVGKVPDANTSSLSDTAGKQFGLAIMSRSAAVPALRCVCGGH